jgi:rRNA-processing protein FCF1
MGRSCKVLLDTNFLLGIARLKIDVFGEIKNKFSENGVGTEFFVLSGVMDELKKLGANKTLEKEAKIAKKLLDRNGAKVLGGKGDVDALLAEKSPEYWVATNDSALRKKIKSFGGRTIYIRKRSFVEIDGI